jgi:hypothetical protein
MSRFVNIIHVYIGWTILKSHAWEIRMQLSMWRCNEELKARVDELVRTNKKGAKYYMGMEILVPMLWTFLVSMSFLDVFIF